jgi:hypothetical protein
MLKQLASTAVIAFWVYFLLLVVLPFIAAVALRAGPGHFIPMYIESGASTPPWDPHKYLKPSPPSYFEAVFFFTSIAFALGILTGCLGQLVSYVRMKQLAGETKR